MKFSIYAARKVKHFFIYFLRIIFALFTIMMSKASSPVIFSLTHLKNLLCEPWQGSGKNFLILCVSTVQQCLIPSRIHIDEVFKTSEILHLENSKCRVKFCSKFVVFYNMKTQRFNEILHQRIVERLKELRKQRGLKQEHVRFDMGEINIGRIEAGDHSITITTLADLCDYYGITLEEFFRGIETK